MFDPFSDFETHGYLQNHFREKDLNVIRELEHTMFRAGFSIGWEKTTKFDYLTALSNEIEKPRDRALDSYLSQFIGEPRSRDSWGGSINNIKGLDGIGAMNNVDGDYSDEQVSKEYLAYKLERERL